MTDLHRGEHGELFEALAAVLGKEVRFDAYTRHLYATDASMYAIEPIGVVFPRDANDVVAVVEIARQFDVPVLPRGAGTSLGGQAVGHAVVLDFSRYMHGILALDADERIARVQPGVVQDELNRAAGVYGLWFAPDTSTSNRATLGGMIGNNSCGSRSARYGMTIDHVAMLDVVLSDGSRARLGPVEPDVLAQRARGNTLEASLYRHVPRLVAASADAIRTGFPSHWRRSGGYRLERLLPERGGFDLSKVVVGSEGTLAIVTEAAVRLVPQPAAIGAVAGHFESVAAALAAVDDARECDAAAIELVDRNILTLASRSPMHAHLASVLEGDPGALLWIEFYGDDTAQAHAAVERLEAKWRAHRHGYAVVRATTPTLLRRFRDLRKAGLGLLMAAGEGGERSLAFVEDTAVDPRRLREYTDRLAAVLSRHGLRAGFYGHASAGCLHVRPFLDLTRAADVRKLRAVAEEVRDLVVEFDGMNSSEHGDGLVRSEFNRLLFGDTLYAAMRDLKRLFDPDYRLNPGKKVDAPPMTENLRDTALPAPGPLRTHFTFAGPHGMRAMANRCARIGACRKSADAGTMCPSFMATRDEAHSTRGRANALVRALSSPDPAAELGDQRLYDILDLCLECKACKTECPLSVDMALMKSEFLAHYHARHGVPLQARVFGHARTLNRIGSAFAPLSNTLVNTRPVRALAERFGGIDRRRPLPRFRRDTLKRWFEQYRAARPSTSDLAGSRGSVVFLADSFTSYTEPEIGRAAIELLEQAGWHVWLAHDVCCGRALISKGLLAEARRTQAALIARLAPAAREGIPIVGCEPSCVLTLKDELLALKHESSDIVRVIAQQARLVDELMVEALADGSLQFEQRAEGSGSRILFHGHCHQKAAGATPASIRVLESIPGAQVTVLDAGCCGMAGSFGFERSHYELSMKIGGMRLFPAIGAASPDTLIAATGVSCRQQIAHATGRAAHHPVAMLHAALRKDGV